MNAKNRLFVLLCLALFVPAAMCQSPRPQRARDDHQELEEPAQPPSAGFWPTDRMMYLLIDRLTEDMSKSYSFTEDQLQQTRELWKDEFPGWLNEHRADIQQLMNEYMEALLEDKAPDPEYVADWAQRVLPLVEEFTDRCEKVGEQMRPYLNEEQQLTLDGHLAGFRVGMKYLNQRLAGWAEGAFDADTEWHRSPGFQDAERKRQEQVQQEAQQAEATARGAAPATPAATGAAAAGNGHENGKSVSSSKPAMDDWGKYVEDFIRRYQLNAEQQGSAYKYLRTLQERRDAFLRRNADELDKARRLASNAKSDTQRTRAEDQLQRLNRPLDNMFNQLKEKLDTIPTRKQRAEAEGSVPGKSETRESSKAASGKGEKP